MRQIIALGGGGFSMEPDRFIHIETIQENYSKDFFIPTASGDSDHYISRFYNFFNKQKCKPSHLSLFKPLTRDLEAFILEKDIIYVGGGNTRNLLVLWKEWGVDHILRKAWNEGIVLAGISAGSICWFEEGVTDSFGEKLEPIKCLGFLKGSHCPHSDGELDRRPSYNRLIYSGDIQPGIAADDGIAIHYVEQNIGNIVSSRPNAKACQVYLDNRVVKVIEEELQPNFLGSY